MEISNTKIVGLIQAHYLDWSGAPDFSLSVIEGKRAIEHVIEKLKSIPEIDGIVIATPKDSGNIIFQEIADANGVTCFLGSQENVLERSKGAIDLIDGDIAVYVMGQHCFIDATLLRKMITTLCATGSSYISLPDDFTPYFAGKVYKRALLEQIENEINMLPISGRDVFRARFSAFIEGNREKFNVIIFKELPVYTEEYLKKIRTAARNIFVDDRLHVIPEEASKVSNPLFESYEFAVKQLKSSDVVLDAACGDGFGCRIMSPHVAKVVGVDIDKELIINNRQKNTITNISYEAENVYALSYPDQTFDVVTGMEIIEHIPLDKVDDFIAEIRRVLKPCGIFVCSTPQNSMGSIPVVPWHEKEYSLEEFKMILRKSFSHLKIYGAKSGGPLTEDEYGQKMVAVCS